MKRLGVAAAAVVLVTACATVRVREDYNPSAPFPAYKTFAIKPGAVSNEYPLWNSPLVGERVKKAITGELTRRGLREAPDQPDLIATWNAGSRTYVEPYPWWGWGWGLGYGPGWGAWGWGGGWGPGYGPGWGAWGWGGWGPGYPGYGGYAYTEGTLVVDLVDAKTNQVVWRGYAQTSYAPDELGGRKGEEKVAKVVEKIFARFPPAEAMARPS